MPTTKPRTRWPLVREGDRPWHAQQPPVPPVPGPTPPGPDPDDPMPVEEPPRPIPIPRDPPAPPLQA